VTNLPFQAAHGLDDAWGHVHEIDSSFHEFFLRGPSILSNCCADEICPTRMAASGITCMRSIRAFMMAFCPHPSRRIRNGPVTPGAGYVAVTDGVRHSSKRAGEWRAT
jgi:hypothetical protein